MDFIRIFTTTKSFLMKKNPIKNFLFFFLLTAIGYTLNAQVGIGTPTPDKSAMLTVESSSRGILIPRVALTDTLDGTTITAGNVESLLIYNTATVKDVTPGFYYWTGDLWARIAVAGELDAGEWIDGTTRATDGDGILAKQANDNGATVFIGDSGKVRMMESDFDATNDGTIAFEAPIFKKYSTDTFGADTADQMFERSNFRIKPDASDIRYTGLRPNLVVDPGYTGTSLANLRGIWNQTVGDGTASSAINTIFGITGAATNKGEGTIGTVTSIYGLPIAESGIINAMNALLAQPISRGSGSVISMKGLFVQPLIAGSGSIQNLYGVDISNQVGLSTADNYGMRIGNISGSANNYSIYTNTGQVSFGDDVEVRANLGVGTDNPTSKLQVVGLPIHADNAAAISAGLTLGAFYHNGDGIVRVVF